MRIGGERVTRCGGRDCADAESLRAGIANEMQRAQILGKAQGDVLDGRASRTGRFIKGEDR
jgi:hypothetical protein